MRTGALGNGRLQPDAAAAAAPPVMLGSLESPADSAAPAAALISTGRTAPPSNMSCMRTFPSTSNGQAPAAKTSSAAGDLPGSCSDFSSTAIATAGASSVAMAAFLTSAAFDRERRGGAPVPPTDLPACLTGVCFAEGRIGFFMGRAPCLRRPRQLVAHRLNHRDGPTGRRKEEKGECCDVSRPTHLSAEIARRFVEAFFAGRGERTALQRPVW